MPVNGSDVKVVYYTRSAYNNLSTKDDNTIYYVQETNGKLSLYIGNRAMGYANDDDVVKLSGDQTIAGKKTFDNEVYLNDEIQVDGSAYFNDDTEFNSSNNFNSDANFNGSAYFYDDAYFNGYTEFNNTVSIASSANIRQNKTPTNGYDLVNKDYVDKQDRVKLLRARSGIDPLTIHSNTSVTSVGSQLERGDTIMFEVNTSSSVTSVTPKILTATVSSTLNSATLGRSITFTTWTGSVMSVFSLSVALINGALIFGNMNYMQMIKSGTDMNITNTTWTPYIGRIWKVDGSVI